MKVLNTQKNSKNCIICGMENDLGLKAPFYNLDDNSVATIVTFKVCHQSYPDRTHGGMVSALLDELMGRALWVIEPNMFGVTTTLNITYRKPVPLGSPVKARAFLTFNSQRGFYAKGQIYSLDNVLLAEGNAKYLKLPFKTVFGENANFHEEMCYDIPIGVNEIDFPQLVK